MTKKRGKIVKMNVKLCDGAWNFWWVCQYYNILNFSLKREHLSKMRSLIIIHCKQ